ncbi:unnamed protein product [Leptidea sinapis]|uniref:Uncharacterized protein n=2 Tax=Leptidea sinapis TaxID=189913 RepID=A0A5E4Q810_9NEOP|nr:unnamed protein product [Leptidea sinapis]
MYAALLPTVQECSQKYGITQEDIKKAKESGNIDNVDQCMLACIFKKTGVINEGGQFDVEKSTEMVKKYVSDANEQAKAIDILGKCASVNDQPVGDSDGCDRSKQLFECLKPFKKEFESRR